MIQIQLLLAAIDNTETLIGNIKSLAFYNNSQILASGVELFNILKIKPNFATQIHEEKGDYKFSWTYTSVNALSLINNKYSYSEAVAERQARIQGLLEKISHLSEAN